jgi:hypothetical protein
MTDFFDGLLPDLDVDGDMLPEPGAPVDLPSSDSLLTTDVVSETWFGEFDAVVPDMGDVALPDPFAPVTAMGAATVGGMLTRRRKPQARAAEQPTPAAEPPSPSSPLDAQTIAAAIELGETSASLLDRLLKLTRPGRKGK